LGRIACVVGATGLVGGHIVRQLLDDPAVERVVTFVRRDSGVRAARLAEQKVEFDRPDEWADLVRGDVLYSALGTTLRTAGSQERQYRVDHTFQLRFARAAAANGVPAFVLISSDGANPSSRFFYLRMKGELERDVEALGFQRLRILQPGMLAGRRAEKRPIERVAAPVLRAVTRLPGLGRYRAIEAEDVARAAIRAATLPEPASARYGPAEIAALGALGAPRIRPRGQA
jgi:uncharacterized protein YbjT (DUF2867 family)